MLSTLKTYTIGAEMSSALTINAISIENKYYQRWKNAINTENKCLSALKINAISSENKCYQHWK